MSRISFSVNAVEGVALGGWSQKYMSVSLAMDDQQMKEAVGEMLGSITASHVVEWLEDLVPDVLTEIRAEAIQQAERDREQQ